MTCKHKSGDPACSSTVGGYAYEEARRSYDKTPTTPDSERYEVVDAAQVGPHLVLKVKYPNCRACSYEGTKVMVYLSVTTLDALKWRKIDPHFADKPSRTKHEAPGPAARFPASAEGWADALAYAAHKARSTTTVTQPHIDDAP